MSEQIHGRKFHAYRPSEAFVRIDWFDGAEVTLTDAREALDATSTLAGGHPTPVLVDMRSMRSIERDGRKAFAESPASSRTAMYVESALSRTVANFFIGLGRPGVPARVFTDLDDAQRWLVGDDDG